MFNEYLIFYTQIYMAQIANCEPYDEKIQKVHFAFILLYNLQTRTACVLTIHKIIGHYHFLNLI